MARPTRLFTQTAAALLLSAPLGVPALAAGIDDPVRSLPGFDAYPGTPGPIARSGSTLYIGITDDVFPSDIVRVNIATPGSEFIIGSWFSAVNPVDLVMTPAGVLYVVDELANFVDRRSATGLWTSIPTPNGGGTYFGYGEKLYLNGDRIYLIHHHENKIDVLDLDSDGVIATITDLDNKPNRIRFTDTHMVVLCSFVSAPNYAVFDLSDLSKEYRRDLSGEFVQPTSIIVRGEYGDPDAVVYVTSQFDQQVVAYDLVTGAFEDQVIDTGTLGRCTAQNEDGLILQRFGSVPGTVLWMAPDLDDILYEFDVIEEEPLTWFPPFEEIHVMPEPDGRVFMTNRNDGTLTIIDEPCPGDVDGTGDVGFGDVVALLAAWGPCPGCPQDLDGDGTVGFSDLIIVLSAWGGCG